MNAKKWGHDELAEDLAGFLRSTNDRMVWTNMQMGPSGSVRPDVYAINKSYTSFRPISYECKVSVADFRSDVTSGKWQTYLPFSAGVMFAVPTGLISKADIPPTSGLIVRGDEGWRVLKSPTLKPVDLTRDHWMKLLISGIDREVNRAPIRIRHFNEFRQVSNISNLFGARAAKVIAQIDRLDRIHDQNEAELRGIQALHDEQVSALRKRHQSEWQQERKRIDEVLLQVRELLGLPPNSSEWDVCHRLRESMTMIRDSESNNLARKTLQAAIGSMQRQLENLEPPIPTNKENKTP